MITPQSAASRALLFVVMSSPSFAAPPDTSPVAGALDRSAEACSEFYQFACGGWQAKNPLPGDQPRFGRFNELADGNRTVLREILEGLAKDDLTREPFDRKVGDYYAACMDEAGIEAKGLSGLKPDLDRVDALASRADLPGLQQDEGRRARLREVWCENVSDESSRFLAQVDVHSPGRHRVNGVVSNLPEFAKAYSCKAGAPMVREKPCRVW